MFLSQRLLALSLCVAMAAEAQTSSIPTTDFERRLADLERKMKELDPSYGATAPNDLAQRLIALERKMAEVMAARAPEPMKPSVQAVAAVPAQSPAPPPPTGPGIQAVSITGDFVTALT